MTIKDFKNKKVTIIGLGLHGGGVGAAKFFSKAGARVLVTDLRNKDELKESLKKLNGKPIKFVLGQHRPEDFINADLIIKNPAVPDNSRYLRIAKEHKVPIDTDIGIFFELCPTPIIGITGTKGKSTVATLIYRLLKQKYSDRVVLGGNIRTSVLDILKEIDKKTKVVLELSSWQLAGLGQHRKSPHYALVTNILPDHLNRYKNIKDYIKDKKEIFRWQGKKDFLILNFDDKIVRKMAGETKKPQVFYYTKENGIISKCGDNRCKGEIGAYTKREKIYFSSNHSDKTDNKKEICSFNDIKLRGDHNINNVLAAITIAKLHNVADKSIKRVLAKFSGVEGRLELIRKVKKVEYINDTTATIPDATLAALASFPLKNNIVLIAGGADKKLNFDQLAEKVAKKVKVLILLDGTATPKLKKAVENQIKLVNSKTKIIGPFNDMGEAVFEARVQATAGDIVLLSPACASFGMFRHEFERGNSFKKAVKKLL